jgi:hypothetical protein
MALATYTLAVVGLIEIVATFGLLRGLRRLNRVDDRLSHLTEALRLLAETTEAGFRASAQELNRVADRPAPAPRPAAPAAKKAATAARAKVRRAVTAVRKGRSVPAAAASETMSESELRLRLHMAESGAARAAAAKEGGRVALRA